MCPSSRCWTGFWSSASAKSARCGRWRTYAHATGTQIVSPDYLIWFFPTRIHHGILKQGSLTTWIVDSYSSKNLWMQEMLPVVMMTALLEEKLTCRGCFRVCVSTLWVLRSSTWGRSLVSPWSSQRGYSSLSLLAFSLDQLRQRLFCRGKLQIF